MRNNISGLRISGLSAMVELACRRVYSDFLSEHRLEAYPAKITVAAFSKLLALEISCGEKPWLSRYAVLTEAPESGLREKFRRELERSVQMRATECDQPGPSGCSESGGRDQVSSNGGVAGAPAAPPEAEPAAEVAETGERVIPFRRWKAALLKRVV